MGRSKAAKAADRNEDRFEQEAAFHLAASQSHNIRHDEMCVGKGDCEVANPNHRHGLVFRCFCWECSWHFAEAMARVKVIAP